MKLNSRILLAFNLLWVVVVVVNSATSSCDVESSTICKFSNQSLACCHAKEATCCESGDFCCPHGFECDLANGRCIKDSMFIPFYLKMDLAEVDEVLNVGKDQLCPDNQTICKEKQTCCNMSTSTYGCCPIEHAHCCDDGVHCCPKNYKCNPSQGKCDRNDNLGSDSIFYEKTIDWLKKEPGQKVTAPCPGGKAECPTGSTCCQLPSGDWGCCPLPNAVCCEDHIHCCPSGYVCDVKDGRCNKQNREFLPFTKKIPAIKPSKSDEDEKKPIDNQIGDYSVVCPDGCSFCANGNTCCKMTDGSYGCCPLPKAVCCEDHLHCCPQFTTCNVKEQTCESSLDNSTTEWYQKAPAKLRLDLSEGQRVKADPVLCDDKITECDPLKVCCKLPDNSYGCCPYADGVCCPGQAYCCPNSMTCGNKTGECLPKIEEEQKPVAKPTKWSDLKKVVSYCNVDETATTTATTNCSKNTTSCRRSDDQLVCCWYEGGVCCGKNGLCCPKGYTCDEANEACQLNDDVAQEEKKESQPVNSCGGRMNSKHMTVCETGCCPFENAVCCSNGLNCCPNGYSCSENSCVKNKN